MDITGQSFHLQPIGTQDVCKLVRLPSTKHLINRTFDSYDMAYRVMYSNSSLISSLT